MKTPLVATTILICLFVFSCTPDLVQPEKHGDRDRPTLAGQDGEHPALDTVCQETDTIFLVRQDDGSPVVNKCYAPGSGVSIPCPPGQPKWGNLVMREGYYDDTNFVDCDFAMAPGWYCDFNNSKFGLQSNFTFDSNGYPIVSGNDWQTQNLDPAENQWKLRLRVVDLESPCFYVALRVHALKLNLFGAIVNGSQTFTWGRNNNWNNPSHAQYSGSQWLTRFCPERCMSGGPPVDTTTVCKVVYTGITCTGNNMNCTTLHPVITDPGTKTYAWSTGATTQDITVCPTSNTNYSVSISVNGVYRHLFIYNVHVIDASCSIPGSGGGGNGSGCGNGGNGSSGSTHHPGCNGNHYYTVGCNGGNHDYGCNAQHSGNTCNHRGHGYHCTTTHASNRACNGGHTRGCDGEHSASQTCQTRSGHRYNCSGNHSSGNCNTSLYHTSGCNNNNHSSWRGCNNGHSHHGHGNGSGYGSGYNGGHGHTHGCGGTPPPPPPIPGVKVCHIPPGNPNGATTICVPYSLLSYHLTNVCPSNGCGNGHSGDMLGACNSNPCN